MSSLPETKGQWNSMQENDTWGILFAIALYIWAVDHGAADFVLNLHSTVLPSRAKPTWKSDFSSWFVVAVVCVHVLEWNNKK